MSREGLRIERAYQPDLIVEDEVVVEIKAIHEVLNVHRAQLRTYLLLHGAAVGLLVNFNVSLLSDGIRRVTA